MNDMKNIRALLAMSAVLAVIIALYPLLLWERWVLPSSASVFVAPFHHYVSGHSGLSWFSETEPVIPFGYWVCYRFLVFFTDPTLANKIVQAATLLLFVSPLWVARRKDWAVFSTSAVLYAFVLFFPPALSFLLGGVPSGFGIAFLFLWLSGLATGSRRLKNASLVGMALFYPPFLFPMILFHILHAVIGRGKRDIREWVRETGEILVLALFLAGSPYYQAGAISGVKGILSPYFQSALESPELQSQKAGARALAHRELCSLLKDLSRESVIASDFDDADDITLYCGIDTLVSRERLKASGGDLEQAQMHRAFDLLGALYAIDQGEADRLVKEYHVTHFVVRKDRYGEGLLPGLAFGGPFQPLLQAYVQNHPQGPWLMEHPPRDKVVSEDRDRLVIRAN